MKEFMIEGKKIMLFPSTTSNCPMIYFNTFDDEGEKVYQLLQKQKCVDFTLAAICDLDWNRDLSPWKAPAVFKNDEDFLGVADDFLKLLIEKIMPQVEENVSGTIKWRGLAGYSLAGLFALYALYKTDLFYKAASMSGSFWFSGFKKYAVSQQMKRQPDSLYFSLGSKECKTRHPYLKMVQQSTEELEAFYRAQGINTFFELNPGNHYQDTTARSAAGIRWILENQEEGSHA